ncbi:endonuclease III homolog 1, chloroplastic-like isoform X2 [Quercus suber]|uniref:endonuclease III homolog 1, chloroplastic-like isoform X2 n=1 Tax=Quercus suber TaxID=58331 RepID=UPI0032DFB2C6
MSLILLGTNLCTSSLAFGFSRIRLFGAMSKPNTTLSSKLLHSKTQVPISDPNPGSESSNGGSVPEQHVYARKKRVKKMIQVKEEGHEAESNSKKLCGLPDIEEFAYKREDDSLPSRKSNPASDVLPVKTEVASSIRPRESIPLERRFKGHL